MELGRPSAAAQECESAHSHYLKQCEKLYFTVKHSQDANKIRRQLLATEHAEDQWVIALAVWQARTERAG